MSFAQNRREFLTSLIATAAAGASATALAGCSDTNSTTTTDAQGSSSGPQSTESSTPARLEDLSVENPFLLGVASGDPLSDSVILWTRLAPEPAAPDGFGGMGAADVPVVWELASDDSFSEILQSGTTTALASLGHSVHVNAAKLDPATWYSYRFRAGQYTSPAGRTRTLPEEDAAPDSLKLAIASCQDYTEGYYGAYRAMAADNLDLVLFLGDYIYEYPSAPDAIRQVPGGICKTLADYRNRYATYKTDADLQAAHAACPWVTTWDDHEVENNYADLVGLKEETEEDLRTRRAAAYQAYYEHQPLRLEPPQGADFRIYRSFKFGALAEFFMLDGRQYRSDQACNAPQDAIVNTDSCENINDESRTMLGEAQETWLSDGLKASEATWAVLGQQTVMSSLVLGNITLNVDQWDGYPAARRRLLEFVDREVDANLVVLTGDIHSAGAGVLSTMAEDGSTTPVGVEFVGTSITSGSLVDIVPGGAALVTPDKFPGIEYLNVKDHGYCRCTVTPESWTAEFVIVSGIKTPDATASVDATLVATAGTPSLSRA